MEKRKQTNLNGFYCHVGPPTSSFERKPTKGLKRLSGTIQRAYNGSCVYSDKNFKIKIDILVWFTLLVSRPCNRPTSNGKTSH